MPLRARSGRGASERRAGRYRSQHQRPDWFATV